MQMCELLAKHTIPHTPRFTLFHNRIYTIPHVPNQHKINIYSYILLKINNYLRPYFYSDKIKGYFYPPHLTHFNLIISTFVSFREYPSFQGRQNTARSSSRADIKHYKTETYAIKKPKDASYTLLTSG